MDRLHKSFKTFLFYLCVIGVASVQAQLPNSVLQLDGQGDYMSLPNADFDELAEATVEGWFKWDDLGFYSQAFSFGSKWFELGVNHRDTAPTLQFFIYQGPDWLYTIQIEDFIQLGQWYHLAAVSGPGGMQLYVNGVLLGEHVFAGSFAAIGNKGSGHFGRERWLQESQGYLGRTQWAENAYLRGGMDEIRVWRVRRSAAQIGRDMHRRLSGKEAGLVALWNFDAGDGRDSSGNGYHGQLIDDAHCVQETLPAVGELLQSALLTGKVVDLRGKPVQKAIVRLEGDGRRLVEVRSDNKGRYSMAVPQVSEIYDLSVTYEDMGRWLLDVPLRPGQLTQRDLTLREAVSIEGTVLTFDKSAPHAAALVEVSRVGADEEQVVASTHSDIGGDYRFVNLKPGSYRVRCEIPVQSVFYKDVLKVGLDTQWPNIDFRFAPYKKGVWKHYKYVDGLAGDRISKLHWGRDGMLWIATHNGLSRFDGAEFSNFLASDGMAHNKVWNVYEDAAGSVWIATHNGLSRFDGYTWGSDDAVRPQLHFTNFNTQDGLPHPQVMSIAQDDAGAMWFGTWGGGVSRFDGAHFTNFKIRDNHYHNLIWTIGRGPAGALWFGTWGGGVWRYEGEQFAMVPALRELEGRQIADIYFAANGALWFATDGLGIYRHDGESMKHFTVRDGLASEVASAVHQSADGLYWLITQSGMTRYDGKNLITYGKDDGLNSTGLVDVVSDADGVLWVGTVRGLVQYDGETLVNFTAADGLIHSSINDLFADDSGGMWLKTAVGVMHYKDGVFTYPTEFVDISIGDIERDTEGRVWLASADKGMMRFAAADTLKLTAADGLGRDQVKDIYIDAEGAVWGASGNWFARYAAGEVQTFFLDGELAKVAIIALIGDGNAGLWFATNAGAVHWDGDKSTHFTVADGLPENYIYTLHRDADGTMWFGTNGGLARYDGEEFVHFTVDDGLGDNHVRSILRDRDGILWVGTALGGVSAFDGAAWTTLDTRNGLAGNTVMAIYQDAEGALFFATTGGLSRYRRGVVQPRVRFVSVLSDRLYRDMAAIEPVQEGSRVTVAYRAIDFKSPAQRQYRYRILGLDEDWRRPTRQTQFEWIPQRAGSYTVELQAIDRDLNYSESARLELQVVTPWYLNAWATVPLGGGIVVLFGVALSYALSYYAQRREAQRLQVQLLEQERRERLVLETSNEQLEHFNSELTEARQEADRANQAKSTFLASMSHEIRTPLNAILGYTQILERRTDLEGELRQAVGTIARSGVHLLELINSVLDLSKVEAGRVEVEEEAFDLALLIDGLDAMFRVPCAQKGMDWQVNWQADQAPERLGVRGDEGKLRQVLINLIGNAIKYTNEGKVELNLARQGDEVYRFEVADSGPGIAAEDQQRLLEPFMQGQTGSRPEGTGLGLAIAHRLLQVMDSDLEINSVLGQGTRMAFALTLPPALAELQQAREVRSVIGLAAGAQVQALVVDDVVENRQVLCQMLRDVGIAVEEAVDGVDALEQVAAQRPDIVFMDVWMPRLDGQEAARQLRAQYGDGCPTLVAVSASVLQHEQQQFLAAGFERFVPKPVLVEDVYQCLDEMLGIELRYADEPEVAPAQLEVELPAELAGRLQEAAEWGRLTELEKALAELAERGAPEAIFAERLRTLTQELRLDEVAAQVGEMKDG